MKIKVLTDSGTCMNKEETESYGIEYLPLQIAIEDKTYLDGVDLSTEQLYDLLDKGHLPRTSMPPLGFIEDTFDRYNEEGVTDIILITLSSGLSGTNSAIQACALNHNIKVHTLDICTTLAPQRYWAICAAKLVEQGVACHEIIKRIQDSVNNSKGYLLPENLEHLARGGRLSPTSAKLAGMLKIIPILEVSKDTQGKVGKDAEKVRTMSKAIKKQCKVIAKATKNPSDYEYFILDSRSEENKALAIRELKEAVGENISLTILPIGAVIASHTGNGAIGLQYAKKVKGM